ncbi:MAG: hypothetical protein WDN49_27000 [Acetobacteraceae bacterium]
MRGTLLLGVLLLSGCKAVPQITGLVVGGAAGGATVNPVVGFGVGVAVAAASDYAMRHVTREWHQGEQDAIAEAASGLDAGGRGPWRVQHSVPLGNEHGQLEVVRRIDNPLAPCKEILFSVEADGEPPAWYSADLCQQATRWKWASAEPAVERWGFLQ